MKKRHERLGCLVWLVVIVILSVAAGLGTHRGIENIPPGIIPWLNVIASVAVGLFVFIAMGVISFLILIANDKEYDEHLDFSARV